jgi:hypothetical protein
VKIFLALTFSTFAFFFEQPKSYVDSLRSFDGKPYLQENCSALICDAHDRISKAKAHCTAQELWEGCQGNLHEVTEVAALSEINWNDVKAGDVITVNGVHVVAYLGNGECIDSDPLQGGVQERSVASLLARKNDAWFAGPVRVQRWVR